MPFEKASREGIAYLKVTGFEDMKGYLGDLPIAVGRAKKMVLEQIGTNVVMTTQVLMHQNSWVWLTGALCNSVRKRVYANKDEVVIYAGDNGKIDYGPYVYYGVGPHYAKGPRRFLEAGFYAERVQILNLIANLVQYVATNPTA